MTGNSRVYDLYQSVNPLYIYFQGLAATEKSTIRGPQVFDCCENGKAMELLKTHIPVSKVCYAVGFESLSSY